MKRAALVALFGMLALACGGGGGGGGETKFKDPNTVSFDFGSAQSPSTEQQTAATTASGAVEDVLSIGSATGADAGNMVGAIAQLPGELANLFDDAISPDNMGNARVSMSRRAAAYLKGDTAAATAGFQESCVSVGDNDIVFTNCSDTSTQQGLTVTETLNGAFHRAAGHVWWDATLALSISGTVDSTAISYSFGYHMSGDVTFGNGSIDGFERADLSVHAKEGSSLDASAAVTYNVDIALDYLTAPELCISQGTLTVKLIWTEKPHGTGVPAEEQNPPDAAIQLTWTGPSPTSCANAVTVAVGTPK